MACASPQCVISEFQQPALPRFDYKASGGASAWLAIYGKMDLSHVFGFPTWEKEVFELLATHYSELKLIFQQ